MEATIPQAKPQTDAEYIAAIEEMQRQIESSLARMDALDAQTQSSMERTNAMLSRIEQMQEQIRRVEDLGQERDKRILLEVENSLLRFERRLPPQN